MSQSLPTKRITVAKIRSRKHEEPIVCLTAYTAMMADMLHSHVDILLVGDSVGTVLHGEKTTIPVTLDDMIRHGRSVMNSKPKCLVIIDLPFGCYEASPEKAFETAAHVLKETGADGVKLEGGAVMAPTIEFLTSRGVPVMAHIGLQPQSVLSTGYKVAGREAAARKKLLEDATAINGAGAFAVVLEAVVESLAREITNAIDIPTIGIGASPLCDGQILVTEDMLGIFEKTPTFVRRYANLREIITDAVFKYAEDVRMRYFPSADETYKDKTIRTDPTVISLRKLKD